QQPLRTSLLDRFDPNAADRHGVTLGELKAVVCNDLRKLLNTRRRCQAFPPELRELERSLVNYGIPDFTSANLGSPQARESFRRDLEQAIRACEPRFKSVQVQFDGPESFDRTLRFKIHAVLYAEPLPEPVVFDSMLEPATGAVDVKEGEA
ncbi:MAG TPA: type VI secretion system baseplate subunit TssE, partial [Pirellulales bacterium]|nr:type VI secretion system baseplate subunit TssE [Pirellulales bacterium]